MRVRRNWYGKAGNQGNCPLYGVDVKRHSMGFGTHFETGAGSIGDCPAFGRECIENNAAYVSCRKMLGGVYEKE